MTFINPLLYMNILGVFKREISNVALSNIFSLLQYKGSKHGFGAQDME